MPVKTPVSPNVRRKRVALLDALALCLVSSSLVAGCERPESAAITQAITAGRDEGAQLRSSLGRVGSSELVSRVVYRGPEGSDAPERIELSLRSPDGTMRPLDVGGPVLTAAVWRGSVVLLTPEDRLFRLTAGGVRELIDQDVAGELAVSSDGSALAYARVPGNESELHVRRVNGDVVVARGYAGIGLLRFSENSSQICFVGARNGGVMGVHVTSSLHDESPRCLTNCTLRAGSEWSEPFIELPVDARSIQCSSSAVSWVTREGQHLSIDLTIGGAR
jgi:hypothetical protein